MNEQASSLLPSIAEHQPALFDLDAFIEDTVQVPAAAGHFTAERLAAQHPQKYQAAVRLVAAGLPRIQISQALGISHHTLLALVAREGPAIAQEKERLKRLSFYGAGLCLESILDDLADDEKRAKMSARDKAWVAGVLTDKGLVLGGEASVIHEIRSAPSHEDWNRTIEAAAEDVEIAPATGLPADDRGQKGDADQAAAAAAEDGSAPGPRPKLLPPAVVGAQLEGGETGVKGD